MMLSLSWGVLGSKRQTRDRSYRCSHFFTRLIHSKLLLRLRYAMDVISSSSWLSSNKEAQPPLNPAIALARGAYSALRLNKSPRVWQQLSWDDFKLHWKFRGNGSIGPSIGSTECATRTALQLWRWGWKDIRIQKQRYLDQDRVVKGRIW